VDDVRLKGLVFGVCVLALAVRLVIEFPAAH